MRRAKNGPMQVHTFSESRLRLHEDGIAVFEHLRPEARNPLTMALRADYRAMLDVVESDDRVRALILAGGGGVFCGGGDVKGMLARLPDGSQATGVRRRILDLNGWLTRLRDLEIPVVAAVDGPAFGGGFAIALCADFILATPRAAFCMVFLRIGALPDMGAIHMLPRAVGLAKAKELLMTGRKVSGPEGERLGFVHALHPPESLQEAALGFARRFLPAPRVALGLTKRLANRAYELDAQQLAELESTAQVACLSEPDHADALARFANKQAARFDWDRND